MVLFVNRDGTPAVERVYKGSAGKDQFFLPVLLILTMVYMYNNQSEFGLDLAYRCMHNVVCQQGLAWNVPCIIRGDTGEGDGTDYYQNMVIWTLPPALQRATLGSARQPGGLIERVLQAGNVVFSDDNEVTQPEHKLQK